MSILSKLLTTIQTDFADVSLSSEPNEGRRAMFTIVVSCFLLATFDYFAKPRFFRRVVAGPLEELFNSGDAWWSGLLPYYYWAGGAFLLRLAIPALIIWIVYRARLGDFGLAKWKSGHLRYYVAAYLVTLPVLVGVSFFASFQKAYPFFKGAREGVAEFVLYELTYFVQFLGVEAFFRGFLLFALFRKFQYWAVPIVAMPYCMIHFGKPFPETIGSILAGLILGYAALKSKSWLPGLALHAGIGFTMDLLCIGQRWNV